MQTPGALWASCRVPGPCGSSCPEMGERIPTKSLSATHTAVGPPGSPTEPGMSLRLDGGGRKRKTRPASRVSLPPDGVCEPSKGGVPGGHRKSPSVTAEFCRPLSPSTSDYDPIWRQGLHGGRRAKVRLSRLSLHTQDIRTWRQTHRGDHVQMQAQAPICRPRTDLPSRPPKEPRW